MLPRVLAFAAIALLTALPLQAQEAIGRPARFAPARSDLSVPSTSDRARHAEPTVVPEQSSRAWVEAVTMTPDFISALPQAGMMDAEVSSAWLDLRQTGANARSVQSSPRWVEALSMTPAVSTPGDPGRTIYRVRLQRPKPEYQLLLFRLFFDDMTEARPTLVAWDESGTVVLRSRELGVGVGLPSSDTVLVPMIGVNTLDVEVPGDGRTVRGAYLDWMTSSEMAHPLNADKRALLPEPFSATGSLRSPRQDNEKFGTVTATLAEDVIRIGPSLAEVASFQFDLEAQPLVALLTFEVANANIEAPPEIYVNGTNVGLVSISLPELADPGYRGEAETMVRQMQFHYTGWLVAQKLVPGALLRAGTNDVMVTSGPGTPVSAVRATQIQLKYFWEKSDYLLKTIP